MTLSLLLWVWVFAAIFPVVPIVMAMHEEGHLSPAEVVTCVVFWPIAGAIALVRLLVMGVASLGRRLF